VEVREEPRSWHRWMVQVGKRRLAPDPVPVGVAAPGEVEVVGPGEGKLVALLLQLVEDHPVVAASPLDLPSVGRPAEEAWSLLDQIGGAHRVHTEELPGGDEVRPGLLLLRLEV